MDIVNTRMTAASSDYSVQNQQVVQGNETPDVVKAKGPGDTEASSERSQELSKQNDAARNSEGVSSDGNTAKVSREDSDKQDSVSVDLETLQAATEQIESFMRTQSRDLVFSVDEDTNRSVVKVRDAASGDLIRQIPSEDVLKLAERIQELQQDVGNKVGVLFNQKI